MVSQNQLVSLCKQPAELCLSLIACRDPDSEDRPKPQNKKPREHGDVPTRAYKKRRRKRDLSVLDALASVCVSSSDTNEAYAVSFEAPHSPDSPTTLFVAGNELTIPIPTLKYFHGLCNQLRSIAQLKVQMRPFQEIVDASNRLGVYVFTFCHAIILYRVDQFVRDDRIGKDLSTWYRWFSPTWVEKWETVLQAIQTLRSAPAQEQEPEKYLRMWTASCTINGILSETPDLFKYVGIINKSLYDWIDKVIDHARSTQILTAKAVSYLRTLFAHPTHHIIYIAPEHSKTIKLDIPTLQKELPSLFQGRDYQGITSFLTPKIPNLETEYTNTPHCEVTLVMYLLKHRPVPQFLEDHKFKDVRYIGCSKSTCLACELFFNRLTYCTKPPKEIVTSKKSRRMYPHYVFPEFTDDLVLDEEMRNELRAEATKQLLYANSVYLKYDLPIWMVVRAVQSLHGPS